MQQTSDFEKSINQAYIVYSENKDICIFMEKTSDFILKFVRKRLNHDPDIISEFYVTYYEKIAECLKRYENYQHLSFIGFFATNIRHEFYNFIRKSRGTEIDSVASHFIIGMQVKISLEEDSVYNSHDDERHRLSRELGKLPMMHRLPVKLYFGLELGMDELQELLIIHNKSDSASDFLKEYRTRRTRRLEKINHLQDRVRKLNHQIHSYKVKNENDDKDKWIMYKRWKDKIIKVIQEERGIYTLQELGALFKVNKATITRRIQKAKNILKGKMKCQNQQQIA